MDTTGSNREAERKGRPEQRLGGRGHSKRAFWKCRLKYLINCRYIRWAQEKGGRIRALKGAQDTTTSRDLGWST
jgi:hypothetical protein